VTETMRFLALELEATFPKTPILPALGNNDSDCGDYAVRPDGRFLADTRDTIAGMIGIAADDGFLKSWDGLGNYVANNPALPHSSVIAINTNFFSPHYRDSCGAGGDGNPARATLTWLNQTRADAASPGRMPSLCVYMIPGADAF